MTTERFMITGALGCIGAWTVRNLVRTSTPVVVFDMGNDLNRLKLIITSDELTRVTFVHGDITDLHALEQALDKHEITRIIHLAALQLPFVKANPSLGAHVNVVGTVNVFEAVAQRKQRIDRVIYASSVAVYDAADAGEQGTVIQHTIAEHPTSLHGVFKQANEGTAHVYWRDQGIASIGLRPATSRPRFPSLEEFDASPLVERIGPLPHTPLPQGVATTIALFRDKVAKGELAVNIL